jgi:hypothetical protein
MIYALYTIIVLVSFSIMLNGFLRGAWKAKIDAFLGLLILCLFVVSFLVAGWKAGLVAIGVATLAALITRPLAARTASRIFASGTGESGHFPGLPPKILEQISHEMQHSIEGKEALLDYCIAEKDIEKVMIEYDISKDDLRKILYELIAVGCGQWICGHFVAASALAYPKTLKYILEAKKKGGGITETAYKVLMYFERGTSLPV